MDSALVPSNGPKIQTVTFDNPPDSPFPAEVRQFPNERSFQEAFTNPQDWAKCEGQLLPISQNIDVFQMIGTMYGGDGRTTFGLPDLSSESPNDYYICINGTIPGFVGP